MYLRSVEWLDNKIRIIDQTRLPWELIYKDLYTVEDVAEAITNMRVRGAPLIGVVAALGLALEAVRHGGTGLSLVNHLKKVYEVLAATRPTAVNLFNAMDLVMDKVKSNPVPETAVKAAIELMETEVENNRRIAEYGAEVLAGKEVVLTHCNTGSLAAVEVGTALGVIIEGFKRGLIKKVYITETRPKLQGARLTSYELLYAGIKPTLVIDSAAPFLIKRGDIDAVIVGADRILRDGTTYNKIGTYMLALAAIENGVEFYVAAPTTTFDLRSNREDVVIEVRGAEEVIRCGGCEVAPKDVDVLNLAFDETPPEYITGIITEKGVLKPPYKESIANLIV